MPKKEKDMTDGPKQHENIVIKDLMKIFNKNADKSTDKEAGTNTYAKDNQAAIKKLKG